MSGAVPFGWCLARQHTKCIVTSPDGTRTCPCDCPNHGSEQSAPETMSEEMGRLISEYYPDGKKSKK